MTARFAILVGPLPFSCSRASHPPTAAPSVVPVYRENSMRRLILPLVILGSASLPAQSHIITHNYTVGGEGGWDYVVPDPPNHRLFIGRSNRLMVVDMNNGHLIGEVMGINGAHGTAIVPGTGRGFATSGEDSSIVDVRHQNLQSPQQNSGGGGRGRDYLRSDHQARLQLQRRREFLDRRRRGQGNAAHEHPTRWKARVRTVGAERNGLRESHRQQPDRRDQCHGTCASRVAGLLRLAKIPFQWRSTFGTNDSSAAAEAE